MQEHEKNFIWLLILGALIAVGKLLNSNEKITVRICLGRAILGSAITSMAGAVLIKFPELPTVALMGIGAFLGILGAQFLEMWLKRQVDKLKL